MTDYERIAHVIRYLEESHTSQPDLASLAERVDLSVSHFHRLFSRWAGITPKDFLQCLTVTYAKELLLRGENVLNCALETGLSGPGRLHDLCVNLEAASPGELKARGKGWTIRFGFADSPFGICLIAESPRGICHLSFVSAEEQGIPEVLHSEWAHAEFQNDSSLAARAVVQIFARSIDGSTSGPPLRALVKGSAFQVKVWRALLQIPRGTVVSYGRLASALGLPSSARAVGNAVGANSLAYLIPCHRVIRDTGLIGGYRWGSVRKRAILAWEADCRTLQKP